MAVTDTWLLSTVVSLPTPPTPPSIISILLYKDFFKQPAWMTACKIKLWYMMVKKGSYYFKCLKYIYLFQKYLESQKIRILYPPLVLPVNLWHDSWTKRAAISAYVKPPLLPEAQFYSLYFSKRKYAWNSSVLRYTAEITRCFFLLCLLFSPYLVQRSKDTEFPFTYVYPKRPHSAPRLFLPEPSHLYSSGTDFLCSSCPKQLLSRLTHLLLRSLIVKTFLTSCLKKLALDIIPLGEELEVEENITTK